MFDTLELHLAAHTQCISHELATGCPSVHLSSMEVDSERQLDKTVEVSDSLRPVGIKSFVTN